MENILISLPIFFFCLVIHEYSHGKMAEWCGDNTAKYLGRLTLNPVAHIDLFGTIILPLILIMSGSRFVFGWAKPVPINPHNFRNPKWDTVKVGLAGPGANIAAALVSAGILRAILAGGMDPGILGGILIMLVVINLVFAFFNLVPVPPLDGSHVIAGFLPARMAYTFESTMQRYGIILIFALMWLGFFERIIFPLAYGVAFILLPKGAF
ncbi:MAG: site-2 protease family protein [bacterium]|nr:site-2 protease family protein [bacterium]MDD5354599.1 site-2 protease family protein [bacterium]MDD5757151.1 site-2 protease family protein [bacterium]